MKKEKTPKVSEETEVTTPVETVETPAKEEEIHTSAHKKEEEIHTPGYVPETHTPEKKSFWQKLNLQWIIWIIGALIVGGIFLYQWMTTYPVAVNPTDASITFNVDDKTYTIPARGSEEIKVSHGNHTVTMNGAEIGKFDFGWFDGEAIINPTMARFVEEEIIYTVNNNPEAYQDKVTINVIEIDGEQYEGAFRLIEPTLYLKKTWDYAPWEGSPSEVTTKSRTQYVIKKQLFYIEEFVKSFY